MIDAFGCPIEPDNTVIWMNRKGASMWLSWGTVEKVVNGKAIVYRKKPQPERYVTLSVGDNMAVIR